MSANKSVFPIAKLDRLERANAHRSECQAMSEVKAPDTRSYAVAGLFSGIGGLEIGLSRAGHRTAFLCEIDPHARDILERIDCEMPIATDVCDVRRLPSETGILAAGFPCTNLSQVGRKEGLAGSASGLVLKVFDILDCNPDISWVLLENVPFMLRLGHGTAIRTLIREFEFRGFKWAYRVIDSRTFGVPHRRERVFILASRDLDPTVLFAHDVGGLSAPPRSEPSAFGFYWTEGNTGLGWAIDAIPSLKGGSGLGIPSPPALWVPGVGFGLPHIEDAERLQGFDAGHTQPSHPGDSQRQRWKLVGNAVTMAASKYIGELLRDMPSSRAFETLPMCNDRMPSAAFNIGSGICRAVVSPYPMSLPVPPIMEFLSQPLTPLSARASAGFLKRVRASTLRTCPGFIEELSDYVDGFTQGPQN